MSTPKYSRKAIGKLDFFQVPFYNKNTIIKEAFSYKKKGGADMDFTGINSALSSFQMIDSTASLQGAASLAVLDQTLESTEVMNQSMIQMMENSVTPHLGSNIDLYV